MFTEKLTQCIIDKVAIQLLRAEKKLRKAEKHLAKACNRDAELGVDLLDPALTLLGIGKERLIEDSDGCAVHDPTSECRDYYYQRFDELKWNARDFFDDIRFEQSQS